MRLGIFIGSITLAGTAIIAAQLSASGENGADRASTTVQIAGGGGIGPDVTYQEIQSTWDWGQVGDIRGYSLGSFTCNIGDEDLLWGNLHEGTPVLAMNAYRLYEGQLLQIGMSWVKHACCAAANNGCGPPCNGNGGSVLGVGCRDIYSASWNGSQSRLGRRSEINAYTGDFVDTSSGTGNAIFKRLQIAVSDLDSDNYPGALYFTEGVYVGTDDAESENWYNNASYKQVTVEIDLDLTPVIPMYTTLPAIVAWHDHGNGIDNADKDVITTEADIPDEGRFILAGKASDNGDGTWRYEYAVLNLNSHRSAGSFSVPLPIGASVSNTGFHDVDYHSGEVYDNTDWNMSLTPLTFTWTSPASFEQDPDTNALRWGTMYNFWMDVDVAPENGEVTIGIFRPGTPNAITATLPVPASGGDCIWDLDDDQIVGVGDLLTLFSVWGPCPGPPGCPGDFNGDGAVGVGDMLEMFANWGPCP